MAKVEAKNQPTRKMVRSTKTGKCVKPMSALIQLLHDSPENHTKNNFYAQEGVYHFLEDPLNLFLALHEATSHCRNLQ